NQPVWSDTYALGGLFLASGLSGAAALVVLFLRWRPSAAATGEALAEADRLFALLELALIAVLLVTLGFAGQLARAVGPPWPWRRPARPSSPPPGAASSWRRWPPRRRASSPSRRTSPTRPRPSASPPAWPTAPDAWTSWWRRPASTSRAAASRTCRSRTG